MHEQISDSDWACDRTLEVGSVGIQSVTEGSIFTKPDLVLGS